MRRIPVSSNIIKTIGYGDRKRILEIEFRHSGQIYRYFDVPAEEYTAFMNAESKGTYLNQHFKQRGYRYIELGPSNNFGNK
jgi:KTSC domain-containing protein